MLVELGVVEQRYRAVLEVLEDGAYVTDVARRYGVARQTVHEWLSRYAKGGLGGLADRSSRPTSRPHQMPAVVGRSASAAGKCSNRIARHRPEKSVFDRLTRVDDRYRSSCL